MCLIMKICRCLHVSHCENLSVPPSCLIVKICLCLHVSHSENLSVPPTCFIDYFLPTLQGDLDFHCPRGFWPPAVAQLRTLANTCDHWPLIPLSSSYASPFPFPPVLTQGQGLYTYTQAQPQSLSLVSRMASCSRDLRTVSLVQVMVTMYSLELVRSSDH